jgi:hypothetical protein
VNTSSAAQWDYLDVYYLANAFNTAQLKKEIVSIKRKFPYCDWHEAFIECCQEAIKTIRASQPKPTITTGAGHIDAADLKARLDIVTIAERYTRLIKAGRNFKALCPFHSEKQPSFMVYPDKQSWHCFGACNTGGDIISLIMKAENLDFKSALAALGGG